MALNSNDSRLLDVFPFLSAISSDEWTEAQPTIRTFPAKTRIFQKEDAAFYGMFLLRGTARITLIGGLGVKSS